MRKTMITAHSGCEGTPENSMESILKGIGLGADCVEIDVRMDPQGKMWLTHNEVEDYTTLVPLETALRKIAESGTAVNCDIKEEKVLLPTLELAQSVGIPRDKLIFSGSVDIDLLLQDPSIVRSAQIFLNLAQIFKFLISASVEPETWEERGILFDDHIDGITDIVKRLDVECINPSFRLMSPQRIAACHARGIGLSLWTVNEEFDQRRLLREGLVNMTTRNVASALRLRKEIREY